MNAEINDIKNAIFYAGDMKDMLTQDFINQHGRPDVIITDPPRAGMHQDVIDVILFAEPKRIVYVLLMALGPDVWRKRQESGWKVIRHVRVRFVLSE